VWGGKRSVVGGGKRDQKDSPGGRGCSRRKFVVSNGVDVSMKAVSSSASSLVGVHVGEVRCRWALEKRSIGEGRILNLGKRGR